MEHVRIRSLPGETERLVQITKRRSQHSKILTPRRWSRTGLLSSTSSGAVCQPPSDGHWRTIAGVRNELKHIQWLLIIKGRPAGVTTGIVEDVLLLLTRSISLATESKIPGTPLAVDSVPLRLINAA